MTMKESRSQHLREVFFFLCLVMGALLLLLSHSESLTLVINGFQESTRQRAASSTAVTVGLSQKLLNIAGSLAAHQLESIVNFTVPEQTVDTITIEPMRLSKFSVGSISAELNTPEGDNTMSLHIKRVELLTGVTNFTFKYGLIKCRGVFVMSLNETSLHPILEGNRTDKGQLLFALKPNPPVDWGVLEFSHTLDSWMCRGAESVVEVFIGNIDKLAEKKIKEALPSVIVEKTNEQFSQLPVATAQIPTMTNKRLVVEPNLVPLSVEAASRLVLASALRELPERDAAMEMPLASLNNCLDILQSSNQLNQTFALASEYNASLLQDVFPEAYRLCPTCQLAVGVASQKAPHVLFGVNNSMSTEVDELLVGVFLVPASEDEEDRVRRAMGPSYTTFEAYIHTEVADTSAPIPVILFSVGAKMGLRDLFFAGAKSNEFHYTIQPIEGFTLTVVESNIAPFDVEGVRRDVEYLLNDVFIAEANADSPYKLPNLIRSALLEIGKDTLLAGTNVGLF